VKSLHQNKKAIAAKGAARKIEDVLHCAGIAIHVAFDFNQESAVGQDRIGSAAKFDILAVGVRPRGIKEDFVDDQLRLESGHTTDPGGEQAKPPDAERFASTRPWTNPMPML
jgi:hypothetical protein